MLENPSLLENERTMIDEVATPKKTETLENQTIIDEMATLKQAETLENQSIEDEQKMIDEIATLKETETLENQTMRDEMATPKQEETIENLSIEEQTISSEGAAPLSTQEQTIDDLAMDLIYNKSFDVSPEESPLPATSTTTLPSMRTETIVATAFSSSSTTFTPYIGSSTVKYPNSVEDMRYIRDEKDVSDIRSAWCQYRTPEGWTYFYNSVTDESSWEQPDLMTDTLTPLNSTPSYENSNSRILPMLQEYQTSPLPVADTNNHQSIQISSPFSPSLSSRSATDTIAAGSQGTSALHISASACHIDGLLLLLQSGTFSANHRDASDSTPLHIVCSTSIISVNQASQLQCAEALLRYGCDANACDANGRTAIHHTVLLTNSILLSTIIMVCKDIQSYLDINIADQDGNTPLVLAAKLNDVACMKLLISSASRDEHHKNPIQLNISKRMIDRIKPSQSKHVDSMSVSSLSGDELDFYDTKQQTQQISKRKSPKNSFISSNKHSAHSQISSKTRSIQQSSEVLGNWIECSTQEGRLYYFNKITRLVQWDNPFIDSPDRVSHESVGKERLREKRSDVMLSNSRTAAVPSSSSNSHYSSTSLQQRQQQKQQQQQEQHELQQRQQRYQHYKPTSMNRTSQQSVAASETSILQFTNDSEKEKHLVVWNKFFENAMKAKKGIEDRGEGYNGDIALPYNLPRLQTSTRGQWPLPPSNEDYMILIDKMSDLLKTMKHGSQIDKRSLVALNTALIAASMVGSIEDAEVFLAHGANAQCVDEQIRTPVHFACKIGEVKLVQLLSDYGADLEAKDLNGMCPIHVASIFGRYDVLVYLLGSAVEVNCETAGTRDTALHLSARNGYVTCCQILLQYGSSLELLNSKGKSALEAARQIQPRTSDVQTVIDFLTGKILEKKKSPKTSSPSSVHSKHENVKLPAVSPPVRTDISDDSNSEARSQSSVQRKYTSNGSDQRNYASNGTAVSRMSAISNKPMVISTTRQQDSSFNNHYQQKMDDDNIDENDFDSQSVTSEELRNILENQRDREEKEREDIVKTATLGTIVKGAVWMTASTLFGSAGLAMSYAVSAVGGAVGKVLLKRNDEERFVIEDEDDIPPIAPPTDAELSQKGMGFNHSFLHPQAQINQNANTNEDVLAALMAPPVRSHMHFPHVLPAPTVAHELNAHVEALRLGLTPRRSSPPQAPEEVRLAIEMAKAAQQNTGTGHRSVRGKGSTRNKQIGSNSGIGHTPAAEGYDNFYDDDYGV